MEVSATTKYIHMSQRKVKLVADAVRGMPVQAALNALRLMPQRAAIAVAKTIKSAAANAENNRTLSPEDLYVARITADKGPTAKRFRAQARGRPAPLLKRSSHITVTVDEKGE